MYFGLYPIIPTSEAETLTFLQKLEIINYKLKKVTDRTAALEENVSSLSERIEAVAETVPDIQATTNADGSLAVLFINGDEYPVNESLSGNFAIYDDNDHSYTGKYTKDGNKLTISFGSEVSSLSGSIHITGLPFEYISSVNASASVFYGGTAMGTTTYHFFQLTIAKAANSGIASLSFGTANVLHISYQSPNSIITANEGTSANLAGLADRAITFII